MSVRKCSAVELDCNQNNVKWISLLLVKSLEGKGGYASEVDEFIHKIMQDDGYLIKPTTMLENPNQSHSYSQQSALAQVAPPLR